jgi:hypothetical protein
MRTPEIFINTLRNIPDGGLATNATATLALVGTAVGVELPPLPHPEGPIRRQTKINGGSKEKTIHHGRR